MVWTDHCAAKAASRQLWLSDGAPSLLKANVVSQPEIYWTALIPGGCQLPFSAASFGQ
jgi:hypothetical protein